MLYRVELTKEKLEFIKVKELGLQMINFSVSLDKKALFFKDLRQDVY